MEVARKLASIRKIAAIDPIPGADMIEVATIDGWKVVVKKGEHRVGDLIVYCEIDSFLPVRPEFEFLRKNCYRKFADGTEGFRIKTVKLRKQLSQGIVFALNTFKFYNYDPDHDVEAADFHMKEGDDVTEALGIIKYDPPAPLTMSGDVAGRFPSYVPKTDQERIQNVFREYKETYSHHEFEVTMKLDGSSMTVFRNGDESGVCSRNWLLKEGDSTFSAVEKKYEIIDKLKNRELNIAIQGELMGPGVQGNREKLPEHQFFVYDVWDIATQSYYSAFLRQGIIALLGLTSVPILGYTSLNNYKDVDDLLSYADISSLNHPIAEGLVFKSILDPSVSFKVINNKFLLECEE